MRQTCAGMFRQAGFIFFLGIAAGLLCNHFRPAGLALTGGTTLPNEDATLPEGVSVIPLAEARKAYSSGRALFLDARDPKIYRSGHIRGARNLPVETVDEDFDQVMAGVAKNALLITYCDGAACDLSARLAEELYFRGYDRVRVLPNGWSRWKAAGLPTGQSDEAAR